MRQERIRIAVRKFGPFEQFMEAAWRAYCAFSGCQVKAEFVPLDLHDLYRETIQEGGLKSGNWDIAHLNTDWIYEACRDGHVQNLSPLLAREAPADFPSGWSAALLGLQQVKEGVFGLPFHDGPECLIYRKDLWENPENQEAFRQRYSKPLRVPHTWADFVEVADFFHRPEQSLYGSVMGVYPDGHNAVFDYCLYLWGRGGSLVDEQGKIQVQTEASAQALAFYRELVQHPRLLHPDSKTYDSVRAGEAFARGEVAMMVNWFGFAAVCEVSPNSNLKGKVGIAPVPGLELGMQTSLNVYWLYTIGKGSKQVDLAYDFIRFVLSPDMDKLLTQTGGIGCRYSTWQDPEINHLIPYYYELGNLHSLSKTLPQKKNWAAMADRIDRLIQEVLQEKAAIARLLEEAQQDLNGLEEA